MFKGPSKKSELLCFKLIKLRVSTTFTTPNINSVLVFRDWFQLVNKHKFRKLAEQSGLKKQFGTFNIWRGMVEDEINKSKQTFCILKIYLQEDNKINVWLFLIIYHTHHKTSCQDYIQYRFLPTWTYLKSASLYTTQHGQN